MIKTLRRFENSTSKPNLGMLLI